MQTTYLNYWILTRTWNSRMVWMASSVYLLHDHTWMESFRLPSGRLLHNKHQSLPVGAIEISYTSQNIVLSISKIVISWRIYQSIRWCCDWTVSVLFSHEPVEYAWGFQRQYWYLIILRIIVPGLSCMWLKY